jgi:DNA-binding winged helix-turn-helix (wHTH) protein
MIALYENPRLFYIGNSLIIDPKKQTISKDQQVQKIEPQLIQLLLLLVSAQGNIVSRERIFEAVWPNMVVTQNSLNQSISKLRKLLGDNSKSPEMIITNPRKGYSFIGLISFPKDSISTTVVDEAVSSSTNISPKNNKALDIQPVKLKKYPKVGIKFIGFSIVFLLITTAFVISVWPKSNKTIVVSPALIITRSGEIPADPISHALSGFLFYGLKNSFAGENVDVRFECSTPAAKQICPESYHFDRSQVIEIKPILRYSGNMLKLNLVIDGVNADIELTTKSLSFDQLDGELDDLLLQLLDRLASSENKKRVLAIAFANLKQAHDPTRSMDRLQLTALAYSQDIEDNTEFVAKLAQSTELCARDCPLVFGAYGRVLLNQYTKNEDAQTLQKSIEYLQQGLPDKLADTRLKLAVAYALSGDFNRANQLLLSIKQVSFFRVKKALTYFLAKKYLKTSPMKPRLKKLNRVSEYLLKKAEN